MLQLKATSYFNAAVPSLIMEAQLIIRGAPAQLFMIE
jgi:hypothetical protein